MILTHWSKYPLGLLYSVEPGYWRDESTLTAYTKPKGFWLSDESDHGWSHWCRAEEWGLSHLVHRTDFRVDLSKTLWLKTTSAIDEFMAEYARPVDQDFWTICPQTPDWKEVGKHYSGIIISPYQWELRLKYNWYYIWDCASACIWDTACLTEISSCISPQDMVTCPID